MRVLVAEDDRQMALELKHILEKNRFTVDLAYDGPSASRYIFHMLHDVIVLNTSMPGLTGLELLELMRHKGNFTPVLLESESCEIEDKVKGLDEGADDYLVKPFALSEFVARVKALARRRGDYIDRTVGYGNVILDVNSYALIVDQKRIPLNNKEFQLFELLIRHPGNVFSTQYLMDLIWGLDAESSINVVWTHIGFLRRKLKKADADIEIRNIRGAGYMLIRCHTE